MPIYRPSSIWDWDIMLDRTRPSRIFDQNFGLALDDDQIFATSPSTYLSPSSYFSSHYRPRRLHSRQESGVSQVDCNKEKFEVKLDVQQFIPEEITVKTVNNTVVIEGKHDEKQDEHGLIQRHFVRKYILPEDVRSDAVVCNLSSDGVLSVSAPRIVQEEEKEAVKVVPIIQTGRPAVIQRQVSSGVGSSGLTGSTGNSTGNANSSGGSAPAGNSTVGNTTLINIQREGSDNKI